MFLVVVFVYAENIDSFQIKLYGKFMVRVDYNSFMVFFRNFC